jgi:hypothetical protein
VKLIRIVALSLLAGASVSSFSAADAANKNVLVIRKAITSAANQKTTAPANSDFEKVDTWLNVNPSNFGSRLNVSIGGGEICRNKTTKAISTKILDCAGLPNLSRQSYTIPATMNPNVRTVVVSAADAFALSSNIKSFNGCSTSTYITVNNNSQGWKVRCDPAELYDGYTKVPSTLMLANNNWPLSNNRFALTAGGITCIDNRTGKAAADQSKCDYIPNPPGIGLSSVPVTAKQSVNLIYVAKSAISSAFPTASAASINALCEKQFTMTVNGANQAWTLTCNPDLISRNFGVYNDNFRISFSSKYYGNSMDVYFSGRKCYDKGSNLNVDDSLCWHLPYANAYASRTVSIPAVTDQKNKTVTISRVAILAVEPKMPAEKMTSFCSSTTSFSGSIGSWKIICIS